MTKRDITARFTVSPTNNQAPLSPMGRCPKLTRYKLIGGATLLTFSVLFMMTSLNRMDGVYLMGTSKAFTFYSISVYQSGFSGRNMASCPEDGSIGAMIHTGQGINNTDSSLSGPGNDHTSTNRLQKRLPSAIVIGARKAGTRALLRFINLHPDVVTSRQETHFFDRYYDAGLDWYRHQMPFSSEDQVTLEKTPNYFVDWEVPERVYNFNSSIKLILIVRNPIDRAVSDYVQLKEKFINGGHGDYFGSFEELAFDRYTGEINKSYAPIKRSLYSRHLEKWLTYFPMSQMFVVDGENIKVKPWEEMHKLEEFLGLSHKISKARFVYNQTKGFYCIRLEKRNRLVNNGDQVKDFIARSEQCLADSKGRDHPVLHYVVRQELLNFFKPFNNRFFAVVGKSFDWI